ncbi:MAG: ABC transporter permease [Bauldia sp.]|nr:ABC transporter permease [Bauldia sp.]MCW5717978.1 ABC transporter permease [Bauldia sp.]
MTRILSRASAYLQALPLTVILLFFLVLPIGMLLVVSFWDYDFIRMYPDFIWLNYDEVVNSAVTWRVYGNTLKYCLIVWALCLFIGFWVAYFLAFHVRTLTMQMALFLICTVPFLTSNVIRMISWVPLLGRNGLLNQTLQNMGLIDEPLEFLLFSDFAVILAMVHLFTLFMVVPIFNTMMRIDRSLIEAARDGGANGLQILWNVIIPLTKPGIAIGSIFIVTLVMGDFVTTRFMSGGQSASVGSIISNQMGLLQYPSAAANAVILLIIVLVMVGAILRFVNIRKEL